jgi:hypothetical protein
MQARQQAEGWDRAPDAFQGVGQELGVAVNWNADTENQETGLFTVPILLYS